MNKKQYTVSFDKLYKLDHLAAHDNILLQNLLINVTVIDEFHVSKEIVLFSYINTTVLDILLPYFNGTLPFLHDLHTRTRHRYNFYSSTRGVF